MSDITTLRNDVRWWTEELRVRQEKVREAIEKLRRRQDELMRAEREDAEKTSHQKAA